MKLLRKYGLILAIPVIMLGLIAFIFPRHTAAVSDPLFSNFGLTLGANGKANLSASDITVTWIDAAHITVKFNKTGEVLDFLPGDGIKGERTQDPLGLVDFFDKSYLCPARITFDTNENTSFNTRTNQILNGVTHFNMDFRPQPGFGCLDTNPDTFPVPTVNSNLSIAYFGVVDAGRIQMVDGTAPGMFTQAAPTGPGSDIFLRDSENSQKCQDKLILDRATNKVRFYELSETTFNSPFNGTPPADVGAESGCFYRNDGGGLTDTSGGFPNSNFPYPLAWTQNFSIAAGQGTTTVPGAAGGAGAPLELNCLWSFNPLTWFMCPLVEGASHVATKLDGEIKNRLSVDTYGPASPFDETNPSGKGTYGAWSAMRTIALSLLVLVALIMVISQAISIGPFDAYTVKKVLPRLFIAVIAISLSWQLSKLAIQFTNDLGNGLGSLISKPFSATLHNPDIDGKGVTLGAFGLGFTFLGGLDIFVVLSLAFTAMMAVLTAFLVITFRNIFMLLLVIIAPVAIIAWILPNTQKAWGFWRESFEGVLLAFPIIIAFITIGRVFAAIASSNPGNDNEFFTQMVVFIAYFGPYFALPAAFRLAGGALATLGGAVNDRSKGIFDKQKKFRGDRKAYVRKQQKEGNRFGRYTDSNRFTNRLNRGLQMGTNLDKAGIRPSRMRANMNSALNTQEHDLATQYGKENHDFASFSADDEKLKAGLHGRNEQEIMDYLEANGGARFSDITTRREAAAEILRAKKGTSEQVFRKAATRALAPTGTAFEDAGEMIEYINAAYGSDRSGAGKALAEMKSASMGAGRADLAGSSYGLIAGQMQAMYDADDNPAAQQAARESAQQAIIGSVYNSQGASTLSHPSMKASSVQNLIPEVQRRLLNAYNTSQEEYTRELARTANLYDTMASSSPQNAQILSEGLLRFNPATSIGVGVSGARPVSNVGGAGGTPGGLATLSNVQEHIEASRSIPEFVQLRRELNSQQQLVNQTGGGAGGQVGGGQAGGGPQTTI